MEMTRSQEHPKWASRSWVHKNFGVPFRQFDKAVAQGLIRSAKFGSTQQSTRVFRVDDLERLLLAVAAGRKPIRVAGKLR